MIDARTGSEREADEQAAQARAEIAAEIAGVFHAPQPFSVAIEALKAGHCIARIGWDYRHRWLLLAPGSTITVDPGRPLGKAAPDLVGEQVVYGAQIDQSQGDVLTPWAVTSADLLAEDWVIYPKD